MENPPDKKIQFSPRPPQSRCTSSCRDRHVLLQHVRLSLEELKSELPEGVSKVDVGRKRKILTEALHELEKKESEERRMRHAHAEARREAALALEERRIASAKEKSDMRHASHFIASIMNKKDQAELRLMKANQRLERIHYGKSLHETLASQRFDALLDREEERRRRLDSVANSRAQSARLLRERKAKQSKEAESRRIAALHNEEATYQSNRQRAICNQTVREERSLSARSERESAAAQRRSVDSERRYRGPSLKTIVNLRGGKGADLELFTIQRDRANRLEMLLVAEKKSDALVKGSAELKEALREVMQRRTEARMQRANDNYIRVLDQKLERYATLKSKDRNKQSFVADQKSAILRQATAKRKAKQIELSAHQKRAEETAEARVDDIRTNLMRRWYRRSSSAVESIIRRCEELGDSPEHDVQGSSE